MSIHLLSSTFNPQAAAAAAYFVGKVERARDIFFSLHRVIMETGLYLEKDHHPVVIICNSRSSRYS